MHMIFSENNAQFKCNFSQNQIEIDFQSLTISKTIFGRIIQKKIKLFFGVCQEIMTGDTTALWFQLYDIANSREISVRIFK